MISKRPTDLQGRTPACFAANWAGDITSTKFDSRILVQRIRTNAARLRSSLQNGGIRLSVPLARVLASLGFQSWVNQGDTDQRLIMIATNVAPIGAIGQRIVVLLRRGQHIGTRVRLEGGDIEAGNGRVAAGFRA